MLPQRHQETRSGAVGEGGSEPGGRSFWSVGGAPWLTFALCPLPSQMLKASGSSSEMMVPLEEPPGSHFLRGMDSGGSFHPPATFTFIQATTSSVPVTCRSRLAQLPAFSGSLPVTARVMISFAHQIIHRFINVLSKYLSSGHYPDRGGQSRDL